MPRWKSSFLILLIAAACIAQTGPELVTPSIRRVGERLACLCGSCKNSVGVCPMLECHHAFPAKGRIAKAQAEGKSDDEIVAAEVKQFGLQALVAPPASGFNLLAWIMPYIAAALGLVALAFFIKRFSRKRGAVAGGPELDQAVFDRYHDQIEKEAAKLD